MFLELPSEVQHIVYDKLIIDDRIALNKALPIKNRIVKTTKTCKQKDKKLHILKHVFKKHKVSSSDISLKLYDFLCENRDDPSIQCMLDENTDLKMKNITNEVSNLSSILSKVDKKEDVCEVIQKATDLKFKDYKTILEHAVKHCSPEYWDTLIGLEKIKEVIPKLSIDVGLIFNMINYVNKDLLKHVVSIQHEHPFLQYSLEKMRLQPYISIFVEPTAIQMLLEDVGIPLNIQEDMVKVHALNGDFETAEKYLKYLMSSW